MNCRESKRLISLLLDGELNSPDEQALNEHLAGCTACRREKEELCALFSGITPPTAVQPSPFFFNKVQRRIEQAQTDVFSFRGFHWPGFVTLAATVTLMLAAGNFLGTTLWSGLQQKDSAEVTVAQAVPGMTAFNDLPEEYDGIYYSDTNRG
jgi:anti-sigma factor RsiW